jgi:hypothetical protein
MYDAGHTQSVNDSAMIFRTLNASLLGELITARSDHHCHSADRLLRCGGKRTQLSQIRTFFSLLLLYLRPLRRFCGGVLIACFACAVQYAISLFIIVCIQLGMGAYLMIINIDSLYSTARGPPTPTRASRNHTHCGNTTGNLTASLDLCSTIFCSALSCEVRVDAHVLSGVVRDGIRMACW